MEYHSASSPRWANAAKTAIDLSVKFTADGEALPYTASQFDPISASLFVLAASGQFGPIADYIKPAIGIDQLRSYADRKADALISTPRLYTSEGGSIKASATQGTRTDLLQLSIWGQTNPAELQNWVTDDHEVMPVTGAGFVALAPQVGEFAKSVFAALAYILNHIAAGDITTFDQIDHYAWPAA